MFPVLGHPLSQVLREHTACVLKVPVGDIFKKQWPPYLTMDQRIVRIGTSCFLQNYGIQKQQENARRLEFLFSLDKVSNLC